MGTSPLAGIRILVVDDHEDTCDVLQQALTHMGGSVHAAASAREALGAVDDVDIVVTDYSMPGETGAWLLDRVRERPRPVPVITMTGYADSYAEELRRASFARVLQKPVDPWRLSDTIVSVLRGA
jgi:hypothetical protein